MTEDAIVGCILGTAVGDALGLPYEGVSRKRSPKLFGPPTRYRFVFGKGMVSDDTEHTCMVAQSLVEAGDDVEYFCDRFASRLRWWSLMLPAGVGKATALSCIKLWLGMSPSDSGVFSAGNGPAMRAAILGAAIDESDKLLEFVRASSRMTHSDPKAEWGAIAIALAARESRLYQKLDANRFMDRLVKAIGPEGEGLTRRLESAVKSVGQGETTIEFADSEGMERGVSGYTFHTVPVAIHAWMSHPDDFVSAIRSVIVCGGDADTTAAIVGGVVGAGVGHKGIDSSLLAGLAEWPRTVSWMEELGRCLEESIENQTAGRPPVANPIGVLIRNLFFLIVVLFHGFRRLAPPY